MGKAEEPPETFEAATESDRRFVFFLRLSHGFVIKRQLFSELYVSCREHADRVLAVVDVNHGRSVWEARVAQPACETPFQNWIYSEAVVPFRVIVMSFKNDVVKIR